MNINCGIVGLPNVGKSSLFNALSSAKAPSSNFPFCTIEPNVAQVMVPNKKFETLCNMVQPHSKVATFIQFIDIAGLVKGASEGKGLGNRFLSHIREVDVILHVVRCFEDDNIIHVDNTVDPIRDIETLHTELILKDIITVEKRLLAFKKAAKTGEKQIIKHITMLEQLLEHLYDNHLSYSWLRKYDKEGNLNDLHLLTSKRMIIGCNVPYDAIKEKNNHVKSVEKWAEEHHQSVELFCASLEEELNDLPLDERKMFLLDMGIESSMLDRIIESVYHELHLITFFTAGKKEVRAWSINRNVTAPEAAGKIHSDMQKGFICAEVIAYEDYIQCGNEQASRDAGLIRQEGKTYVVKPFDIIHFKFNV